VYKLNWVNPQLDSAWFSTLVHVKWKTEFQILLLFPPNATCTAYTEDALEECDDDNVVNGDGCNSVCGIELGWTCDEFYPETTTKAGQQTTTKSKCTQATVLFQPVSALITVEEGYQVGLALFTTLFCSQNTS
jgi:cysteine-rich repeat protein